MSDLIEILIVDDELDFLDKIAERLGERGFRVTKAANGKEALADFYFAQASPA